MPKLLVPPALGLLESLLVGCASTWTPTTFGAARTREKSSTPAISSATSGPRSPMTDDTWRHTLLIGAVNGEPRLVEPVENGQISSAARGITLAPANFLGALFGPPGPQIRILQQHWDRGSLTLTATQGDTLVTPPKNSEAIRVTFHSPDRGLLEFLGRQHLLRNAPDAFVPPYRPLLDRDRPAE
jgi:hypothetical protein